MEQLGRLGEGERYVEFLQQLLRDRTRPLIIIADQASFHKSSAVHKFVRAHRTKIRLFFFPTHSPELNPDEQVWNEPKHRQLGKQPIKKNRPEETNSFHPEIVTAQSRKSSIIFSTS